MTTHPRLFVYYGIVMIQIFTLASFAEKIKYAGFPTIFTSNTHNSGDKHSGVSSIAELISNDGKVSSLAGVKFYSPKPSKKSNFLLPWMYSKKKNGYTTGTVQIYPDSLTASASTYEHPKEGVAQSNTAIRWPMLHNLFAQTFSPLSQENPLPPYVFKHFDPPFPNFETTWFTPFPPFVNFW